VRCPLLLIRGNLSLPPPKRDQSAQGNHERCGDGLDRPRPDRAAGHLSFHFLGKPVCFGRVEQQVKRVKTAQDLDVGTVEVGVAFPLAVQLLDTFDRALFELGNGTELDRSRGTSLCASGYQTILQLIIT
jgi:hypothetical protein